MATITGTTGNDILTIQADTTSVQAGAGTDTVIFSGNYADYTFSQSDSYVPLMTHNTANQVVSLHGVEQIQFDDGLYELSTISTKVFQVDAFVNWNAAPSISSLDNGGFIVTWFGEGSLDDYGVYAQRYDANGNSIADEFLVNASSGSDGAQRDPSVAVLNDGGFVITWSYENKGIYAQRYDADGNVSEVEFRVNTDTTYYTSYTEAYSPSVGALNDGGYIIAWDTGLNGGYSIAKGVYAQRYDANGETVGNEFKLGIGDEGASTSISALSNDGFVISWRSGDSVHGNVISQIYNSNGEFVNEYLATDESMMIDGVSVSQLNNGDFVTAWAGGDNIYIRYYDVSGDTWIVLPI